MFEVVDKIGNRSFDADSRKILAAPIRGWNCKYYNPGIHISSRDEAWLTWEELHNKRVHLGFHTFISRKKAEGWSNHPQLKVVPVWVHVDNIVAVDDDDKEVVCTKLTIHKRDYNRATGRK